MNNQFSLSKRNDLVFPEKVQDDSGEEYEINAGHQTVLRVYRLLEDEDIAEHHRIIKACSMFFKTPCPTEIGYRLMLRFIINSDEFLGEEDDGKEKATPKKVLDFEVDAPEIYASFLQTYGIDLIDTDIHWYRFCVLFASMMRNENNPISAKIHLRTLDTSQLKGKARSRAEAAKQSVALQEKVSKYDQMLEDRLFEAIQNGKDITEILKLRR